MWSIAGCVQSVLFEHFSDRDRPRQMSSTVGQLLAGKDRRSTLVVVGSGRSCGYYPNSSWEGAILWPFPGLGPKGNSLPEVEQLDAHTLEAHSTGGFSIPIEGTETPVVSKDPYSPGGIRQPRVAPFDADQTYREPGMSITWSGRKGNSPLVLRAHFDQPLDQMVVLVIKPNCAGAELLPMRSE
jgi:hypothetical protein